MALDARDANGMTALHLAAQANSVEAMSVLLQAGADVNSRTEMGSTPLMAAAKAGAVKAVTELIAAGADVRLANRRGMIAFDFANATEKRNELKKLLKRAEESQAKAKRQAGPTPQQVLMEAAATGDLSKIRECLKAGVPVNAAAGNGQTALALAAGCGSAEAVAALLEAGADPNSRQINGDTPLLDAAFAGDAEVVRLLLRHGAEVNAANAHGCTPLMAAASQGAIEVARVLLEAGADTSARGSFAIYQNKTALEYARTIESRSARKAMVDLLTTAATPGVAPAEEPDEDLASAAGQPSFQKILELFKELDAAPKPWKKCAGAFRCGGLTAARLQKHFAGDEELRESLATTKPKERRALLLARLQAHVRKAGFQLLGQGMDSTSFLLFPTADKYTVLRACGTDGINYGHTTEDIVAWLQDMEKQNPFVLTACSHDYVAGEFQRPPRDAGTLAERMCKFCPDLVDGDVIASPAQVAAELEQTRQFGLWWG